MNDRIEKQIELKAPLSRVWRALTDHEQFGEWFRVKMDGPFAEGKTSRGKILIPGYDHAHHRPARRYRPAEPVPELDGY